MAQTLGAAFLRCAVGPLHYAGSCILSGKIPEGLKELSVDNLHGGFKRGLEEAAKQVGVDVADVEGLLPVAEVNVAAVRLDTAQKGAELAWATYAGQVGGLLKGVTDLTVDGRAPDIAGFLERLSQKVVRDPPLAEPLHALSVAVGVWGDLMDRCGDLVENGDALKRAYRARRVRRVASAVVAAVIVLALLPLALWIRAVRARVEAALADTDPCTVLAVAARDLERASAAQQARAAERRVACEDQKQKAADAREAELRREEKAREEARLQQEREAKCARLADHLAKGGVEPEDAVVADERGPLLIRVAKRSLAPEDMSTTALPCADTPAAARIDDAFSAAVLASPAAWANADAFSGRVEQLLVGHRTDLPTRARYGLLAHADEMVKRAMIVKTAAAVDQAAKLCKLKDDLEIKGSKFCPALAKLRAAGKL